MSDFVGTNNKLSFVLSQLDGYSGIKQRNAGSTFVCCPFHPEKTPSCRIFHSATTKSPGYFKCYGCGANGNWDIVSAPLGLQPYKKQAPKEEFANLSMLPTSIEDVKASSTEFVEEEMKFEDVPRNKLWREIKTNLLIALGAKVCRVKHQEYGWLKKKLYLPVLVNGELRGYIKARFTKHENYPSYVNASGAWSKTHGLFPYDYAVEVMKGTKTSTIVLVEGPRDALRLLQAGIPAMCILGTQSWTKNKSKLLELADVNHVILMMDGDCAGKAAVDFIEPYLETMFRVTKIKLWALKGSPYIQFKHEDEPSKAAKTAGVSLWDPCNCPEWILTKLKTTFFNKG